MRFFDKRASVSAQREVRSLIDVLRANLDCGATVTLEATGTDAEEALTGLENLLTEFATRKES